MTDTHVTVSPLEGSRGWKVEIVETEGEDGIWPKPGRKVAFSTRHRGDAAAMASKIAAAINIHGDSKAQVIWAKPQDRATPQPVQLAAEALTHYIGWAAGGEINADQRVEIEDIVKVLYDQAVSNAVRIATQEREK